ncbi:Extracellular metalloprotease-like protein 1 [Elsinoe fawcettii]|nr:Extracellular metalloprotease-like protein 1 [Elsinoe fawcettii]
MRSVLSILALVAFTTARIIPGTNTSAFDCGVGVGSADPNFLATISKLDAANDTVSSSAARTFSHISRLFTRQTKAIEVPTYFHILTKTSNSASVTQKMITDQIIALNAAYSPHSITFKLLGTTINANDAWAVAAGQDMDNMKAALRQGTYNTLNLYFHSDLSGAILGTCTLPSNIGPGVPAKSTYAADGCNVAAQTMPGGTIRGYNSGKTAVHEVGHWLGLLHVFEGYSCTGNGDFISDTPMQSTSTDGCPTKPAKDSCPSVKGTDAVHNYMDYSTDACYERFTTGQIQRVRSLWGKFRQGR